MNRTLILILSLPVLLAFRDDDFKPDLSGIAVDENLKKVINKEKAREIISIIKEARESALRVIYQNLGYRDPIQARISFADGGEGTGLARTRREFTDTQTGETRIIIWVNNIARSRLSRYQIEAALAHELIHAYLYNKLTPKDHDKLPKWLTEGMAVFGSDEVVYRAYLALKKHKATPEHIVNGLEDPRNDKFDYVEDGLLYEYIRVRHGEEKVKAFAAALAGGNLDYKETIKTAIGEDFQTFKDRVKTFSMDWLRKLDRSGP